LPGRCLLLGSGFGRHGFSSGGRALNIIVGDSGPTDRNRTGRATHMQ
jgi:hypothetical protein